MRFKSRRIYLDDEGDKNTQFPNEFISNSIDKYMLSYWGLIGPDQLAANKLSILEGKGAVIARYKYTDGRLLYIITEMEHSFIIVCPQESMSNGGYEKTLKLAMEDMKISLTKLRASSGRR